MLILSYAEKWLRCLNIWKNNEHLYYKYNQDFIWSLTPYLAIER